MTKLPYIQRFQQYLNDDGVLEQTYKIQLERDDALKMKSRIEQIVEGFDE